MLYAIGSSNGNLRFGPMGCVRRICFPRVALPTVKFVSRSLRLYSLLGVGSVRVVVGRESGRAGGEVTPHRLFTLSRTHVELCCNLLNLESCISSFFGEILG